MNQELSPDDVAHEIFMTYKIMEVLNYDKEKIYVIYPLFGWYEFAF